MTFALEEAWRWKQSGGAGGEAVPVERVRLATETVTEDAAVNEIVRKEQIEEPGIQSNPREAGR